MTPHNDTLRAFNKNLNLTVKITTSFQPNHNHFPLPFLIEFSYIRLEHVLVFLTNKIGFPFTGGDWGENGGIYPSP